MVYLFFCVIIFLTSHFGVKMMIQWTQRHGVLDIPNERSCHYRPTPRGGGLPMVVTAVVGLVLYEVLQPARELLAVLVLAILMIAVALLSWLDDRKHLSTMTRLCGHLVVATIAIIYFGGWRSFSLPLVGDISLGWAGIPLAFLWVVGLMNAYNFMDGIDGMAGGQAAVACGCWALIAADSQDSFVLVASLSVLAASVGFLIHNWAPAKIFLGDVGSVFLGLFFSLLPFLRLTGGSLCPIEGALILWPFLFDTIFTFINRLRHGENVLVAHRNHLYQRLVRSGLSHSFVALIYMISALVGGCIAFLLHRGSPVASILLLLVPNLALALWGFTRYCENAQLVKIPAGLPVRSSLGTQFWRPKSLEGRATAKTNNPFSIDP